jgi:hypothetical protein
MKKIQRDYEKVCNQYIEEFCEKQGLEFDGWVGDIVGGVTSFDGFDFAFHFHDIVWDINSEQPKVLIIKWYFDILDNEEYINYFSYSKGLRHSDLKETAL